MNSIINKYCFIHIISAQQLPVATIFLQWQITQQLTSTTGTFLIKFTTPEEKNISKQMTSTTGSFLIQFTTSKIGIRVPNRSTIRPFGVINDYCIIYLTYFIFTFQCVFIVLVRFYVLLYYFTVFRKQECNLPNWKKMTKDRTKRKPMVTQG